MRYNVFYNEDTKTTTSGEYTDLRRQYSKYKFLVSNTHPHHANIILCDLSLKNVSTYVDLNDYRKGHTLFNCNKTYS